MWGLNPNKAEGPDQIPTRFLKEFAVELTPAMTPIFQASLQQDKVPDDWKQANVTPIFKKGDRSSAPNYRPISLTLVCSKILEHIIHSQIMRHLPVDAHQILSDQQHGFRKKRFMREPTDPHNTRSSLIKGGKWTSGRSSLTGFQ